MRPIDWDEDHVQLQCPACGAATTMGARAYFWALGRHVAVSCPSCRAASQVEDRRTLDAVVASDRRFAAQDTGASGPQA
ncbi:MAG TPA: hypothetical protein VGF21_14875 [Thermoleophilaceae bacterium]|jgi:endogenous inhibitor of DNA gyrase (YacG/DUF329 family)